MRVTARDGGPERKITIGCVVDRTVVAAVSQSYEPGLLSKYADTVVSWCVEYYRTYKKAPMRQVETLFERWAETREGKDKDTVQLIDQFLRSLDGEYKRLKQGLNPDHLIDLAADRFNRNKLKKFAEDVQSDIENGDVKAAEERRLAYKRIDIGLKNGVDFGRDATVIDRLFERSKAPLVTYKGALAHMLNPALTVEAFVAFMGPVNSGKSMWVADVAWRAMLQGKKVAFFETGDQTEPQLTARLIARQAKRPFLRPPDGEYKYPTSIISTDEIEAEDRECLRDMTKKEAQKAYDRLAKGWDGPRLRISYHPSGSINMNGIRGVLDGWAREDWWPHVICIDYADLLAPLDRKLDKRDQINESWTSMRALSQERHVLLVTATQTNRVSFKAELIGPEHVCDDRRKLDHATGVFGINRTDAEVENATCRINCVKGRWWKYNRSKVAHVAGCYELARPAVLSSF